MNFSRIQFGGRLQVSLVVAVTAVASIAIAVPSGAKISHAGWPSNMRVQIAGNNGGVMRGRNGVHNELLGGDGNDTIYAGNEGDVIWGDKNPSGQPTSQHDRLHGGAGNDFIYSSHGLNDIWTGAGSDYIYLLDGHGTVYCNGAGHKTLAMHASKSERPWNLVGCHDYTIDSL